MKTAIVVLGLSAGLILADAEAEPTHVVCTPSPIICTSFAVTPHDRFDPAVQHLLVRQQLESLPTGWQIVNFYMPYPVNIRAIEESQIHFLIQLKQLSRTEEAAAEDVEPSEAEKSESE